MPMKRNSFNYVHLDVRQKLEELCSTQTDYYTYHVLFYQRVWELSVHEHLCRLPWESYVMPYYP